MDTRDYTVTIVLLPRLPTFPSPLSSLSHLTRCTFCAELSDSPVRFSLIVRYSLFDPRERNDTVFLSFFFAQLTPLFRRLYKVFSNEQLEFRRILSYGCSKAKARSKVYDF